MQRTSGLPLLALLLAAPLPAENLLIIPFFNTSKSRQIDWIGDGISEKLFEVLSAAGKSVVDPAERDEIFRQLAIRRYAVLTKATVTELGINLDADQILYGDFQFTPAPASAEPAPSPGSTPPAPRGNVRIQANLINIRQVSRGPAFVVSGPIEDLARLETELAWQAVRALQPSFAQTREEFLRGNPPLRLDAMESYIRGLLANVPDQKLRFFAQAARLEPSYSQPCYQLGKMLYTRRDYKQAIEWLQRVNEADAHYREAQFFLGLSRYVSGDYVSAGVAWQRLAQRVPLAEVLNNLGVTQLRLSQAGAAETLRKAVETDPSDPDVQFNAGYALWRQGSFEEAAGFFRETLQRRPEDQDATLLLGRCLARTGPRPDEVRTEGLERLKREYNEKAWLALQSVLSPKR